MSDTLDKVIADLKAAKEGSMGLSREVARAVGWVNRGNSRKGEWFHPSDVVDGKPMLDSLRGTDVHREPPDYTRSLDAALMLKPKGWRYEISTDHHASYPESAAHATLMSEPWADPGAGQGTVMEGHAATAPLALCIASLEAKIAANA